MTKKYHTVYKTINNINGKIYIGVHSTNNLKDSYIGSGKALLRAIKKYGKENFSKRILYVTEHKELAYRLEKLLVTQNIVKNSNYYNQVVGGKITMTREEQIKRSERMFVNNPAKNMTTETKRKIALSRMGKSSGNKGNFKREGDGKYENCSRSKEMNPRAKKFTLVSPDRETFVIVLRENLKKFCEEYNIHFGILDISVDEKKRIISEEFLNEKFKKRNNIINNTKNWKISVERASNAR